MASSAILWYLSFKSLSTLVCWSIERLCICLFENYTVNTIVPIIPIVCARLSMSAGLEIIEYRCARERLWPEIKLGIGQNLVMKIDHSLYIMKGSANPYIFNQNNLLQINNFHSACDILWFKQSIESTFDAQRSTDDWSNYREREPCNNVARLIWIDRIHVCLEWHNMIPARTLRMLEWASMQGIWLLIESLAYSRFYQL